MTMTSGSPQSITSRYIGSLGVRFGARFYILSSMFLHPRGIRDVCGVRSRAQVGYRARVFNGMWYSGVITRRVKCTSFFRLGGLFYGHVFPSRRSSQGFGASTGTLIFRPCGLPFINGGEGGGGLTFFGDVKGLYLERSYANKFFREQYRFEGDCFMVAISFMIIGGASHHIRFIGGVSTREVSG